MTTVIQVKQLRKQYHHVQVLHDLSFQVEKGEILGILGINGAGKTTTLECMEGLRSYDHGDIKIAGRIGIQLQSSALPSFIKPLEAVALFAKWNHTEMNTSMLTALGIPAFAKKPYIELSTGQKRRLHLALALISDPDILFLDEPTAGLDVEGRISLHQQIRELKAQHKTMILATHDMKEVEDLCDRILILKKGHIAFFGTLDELRRKVGTKFTIHIMTMQGEACITTDNIADTLLQQLERYKADHVEITDIQIDRGTLEQHFIDITKEDE